MDTNTYTALADQVSRQTPELAALEADIAAKQPAVDALQAALEAADESGIEAAQEALAGPKSELDGIKVRAEAIRTAIAQCQGELDASGLTVDTAAVKLAEAKTAAALKIDADADAIYGAVQGNRIEEYRTAESEALAFKAAGYSGTAPSVTAWATAKGWTATQACDDILATATAWRGAQAAIRAARLARKEQARAATNQAGIEAALAAWGAFRAAVRTQLGLTP